MNMFMSDSPSYKFLDAKDFVLLIITITEYIYLLYSENNTQLKKTPITNNPQG